jgi:hypothetical protein
MSAGGRNRLNLVGQRFGRLVAAKYVGALPKPPYATLFHCRCDCGGETVARGPELKSGHTRSCGCLAREAAPRNAKSIHREAQPNLTIEYRTWIAMKYRCCNPSCKAFRNYGGRGIRVCRRWLGCYAAFLADMGRRPSAQHSLDRIDNDGDYTPKNCRWATEHQQNSNRRSKRR